jgi:hypothetical protein
MVSIRCKLVVKAELDKIGVSYGAIELGKVELEKNLTPDQHKKLQDGLLRAKLELMDDEHSQLIEMIKNIIVEMIHYSGAPLKINFSDFLSEKLNHNYNSLSHLFSLTTGITIEQYIIAQKLNGSKNCCYMMNSR